MTEAKHTELPWTTTFGRRHWQIRGGEMVIADTVHGNPDLQKANAALIVKAVNNHQALVDALTIIANSHGNNPSDELASLPRSDYLELYLTEIRKEARAALKAVQS